MFNSGHVGCCDSSVELHATKHFVNTRHPVMVALLNKPWKWCYIHNIFNIFTTSYFSGI